MKVFVTLLALAITIAAAPGDFSKISPQLQTSLNRAETANVFISFKVGTKEVLTAIADTRFPTRDDRLNALGSALKTNAESTQAEVIKYVQSVDTLSFTTLWLTNQLYIQNVDISTLIRLSGFDEVSKITEEEIITLDDPEVNTPIIRGRETILAEWGIQKIEAPKAQALLNSTTNINQVVVATIDTGVRVTHEALRDNFFGQYGWFDPYKQTLEPNDQNGHGTHTTGTICGKGGIGVYQDAKWMACKGCATSSCAQSALIQCSEFFTCPTLPDKTKPDCTKAPHLVSNSWGGGQGNYWFDEVIAAWHVAGIIPLFSIGNSGPKCNTANSPGDRNVIGVGSTTVEDAISSFSSVGPSVDGRMKPEISAPGSNVLSAYHTSDDAYRSLSGTSMACPHAAGLTAFLLAFDSKLTFDQVTASMFEGVEREPLQSSGKVCEGIPDNQFPNHVFGHGRINAFFSLSKLIDSRK